MKHAVVKLAGALLATFAAQIASASPVVQSCSMTQGPDGGPVTITYTLSEQPAVVTLDIETNVVVNGETVGWASIGGEHIWNATGDVWKKVTTTNGRITWRPYKTWTNANGDGFVLDGTTHKARAKLTAWPIDNPPDYMVVDITEAAAPGMQRYYASTNFIPGGLLANEDYRKSKLVMRKIMADGVTWTMGSTSRETLRKISDGHDLEPPHLVTLTNNYYIGVFPITIMQGVNIWGTPYWYFKDAADWEMRPVEGACYNEIRVSGAQADDSTYHWPNPPKDVSFIGRMRSRTGIAFDLPSDAEWEFACRAGNGDTKWPDGSAILNTRSDSNLNRLARVLNNPSSNNNKNAAGTTLSDVGGTAIVGSYAPNDWGIYDMLGNVREWCIDYFSSDSTLTSLGGRVNTTSDSRGRVLRGFDWRCEADWVRPAARAYEVPGSRANARSSFIGFRVACPVDVP
ncbi:MAG: SUMF1/EgtB/PvdO family nonheme iron enzyme [Kiritimatiellae bacterium]|nr:SUMF1/EgtB/PvdO family nonheme iron enzyme [Kiritimatiellia bacterium]